MATKVSKVVTYHEELPLMKLPDISINYTRPVAIKHGKM